MSFEVEFLRRHADAKIAQAHGPLDLSVRVDRIERTVTRCDGACSKSMAEG
jgi:hypothetical protein